MVSFMYFMWGFLVAMLTSFFDCYRNVLSAMGDYGLVLLLA